MANFYTPDTAVYLCNVPINSNQKNQFVPYTSVQNGTVWAKDQYQDQQRQWFSDHTTHSFTDFTYQRKDNIIRVPVNAETLFADGTNYCYYQNTHYNSKWFYCFIERIEFINENMTALHIKTDVFQTWFFEFYKSNHMDVNFIARETVIKDEKYKHTLSEPLPVPEYKIINDNEQYASAPSAMVSITPDLKARNKEEFNQNYYVGIFTSDEIKELAAIQAPVLSYTGGNPNCCYLYGMDTDAIPYFVEVANRNGQGDAIIASVAIPKFMVNYSDYPIIPPDPPTPTPGLLYLGSPFDSSFKLTQTYNPPNHDGQDIIGLTNDNVYSPWNGVVVDARWENDNDHSQGYGQLVRIQITDSGIMNGGYAIFGHLNTISVSTGQTINRGDLIGLQGWTGYTIPSGAQGKHLHYQLCGANGDGWHTDLQNPSTFAMYPNEYGTY